MDPYWLYQTNAAHNDIKFEIELPTADNSISLLDFTLQVHKDGTINSDFYQKKAKAKLLPHFESALPTNVKRTILKNEVERRKERCSSPTRARRHVEEFKNTMRNNGYPDNFLSDTACGTRRNSVREDFVKDYIYFEFPYVNDSIDRQVRQIFKDLDLPVRLYRKSFTLRNALQKRRSNTEVCSMRDCYLNNELCFVKNCVYKLTCDNCQQAYIGSTIRPFHARVKEHFTRPVSSVFQHRTKCHGDFTPVIICRENDPVKLRFKEALLITKHNAAINSRAEREELQHLIHFSDVTSSWTVWTRHPTSHEHDVIITED